MLPAHYHQQQTPAHIYGSTQLDNIARKPYYIVPVQVRKLSLSEHIKVINELVVVRNSKAAREWRSQAQNFGSAGHF
jgi:hypothetical protein